MLFGGVVWFALCASCFFFCAQSVRPRYQSMTSIAYLHDCHCCHNERSIVQKKKQTCVDHLDRVLAGCCWEVQATRFTPSESLSSLHELAKCLTMELAVYLAKEVAAILRAVLTRDQEAVQRQYCSFTMLQLLDGRGMGSPIPSPEEGAWTREGPKFLDGGL